MENQMQQKSLYQVKQHKSNFMTNSDQQSGNQSRNSRQHQQVQGDASDIFSKYIMKNASNQKPDKTDIHKLNFRGVDQRQEQNDEEAVDEYEQISEEDQYSREDKVKQSSVRQEQQISAEKQQQSYHEQQSQPEIFKQIGSIETLGKRFQDNKSKESIVGKDGSMNTYQKDKQSIKPTETYKQEVDRNPSSDDNNDSPIHRRFYNTELKSGNRISAKRDSNDENSQMTDSDHSNQSESQERGNNSPNNIQYQQIHSKHTSSLSKQQVQWKHNQSKVYSEVQESQSQEQPQPEQFQNESSKALGMLVKKYQNRSKIVPSGQVQQQDQQMQSSSTSKFNQQSYKRKLQEIQAFHLVQSYNQVQKSNQMPKQKNVDNQFSKITIDNKSSPIQIENSKRSVQKIRKKQNKSLIQVQSSNSKLNPKPVCHSNHVNNVYSKQQQITQNDTVKISPLNNGKLLLNQSNQVHQNKKLSFIKESRKESPLNVNTQKIRQDINQQLQLLWNTQKNSSPNLYYSQNKPFNGSNHSPTNSNNNSLQKITTLQLELMQKIDHLELMIKDLNQIKTQRDHYKESSRFSKKSMNKKNSISSKQLIIKSPPKKFINKRLQENYQINLNKQGNKFKEETQKGLSCSQIDQKIQKPNLKKNENSKHLTKQNYLSQNFETSLRKYDRIKGIQTKKSTKIFSHDEYSEKSLSSKSSFNYKPQFSSSKKSSLLEQIRLLKKKVQSLQRQKLQKKQRSNKLRQKAKSNIYSEQNLQTKRQYLSNQAKTKRYVKGYETQTKFNGNSRNEKDAQSQMQRDKIGYSQKLNLFSKDKSRHSKQNPTSQYDEYNQKAYQESKTKRNFQKYNQRHQRHSSKQKDVLVSYQIVQSPVHRINEQNQNLQFFKSPILLNPPNVYDNQQQLTKKVLTVYKKLQKILNVDFSGITQLKIKKYEKFVTFQISPQYDSKYNIIYYFPQHNVIEQKQSALLYCGQWRSIYLKTGIQTKIKYGIGIELSEKNYFYKGNFRDDAKNGQGIMYFYNGDVYYGEWSDNHMEGKGVMVSFQGDVYDGAWKHSRKHGYAQEKFRNGDKYKGFYKKGLFSGQGKYKWTNGSSYKGDFHKGHLHGKGIWKSGEGDIYEGQYCNDLKHGYGIYQWKNGAIYEGYFQNGVKAQIQAHHKSFENHKHRHSHKNIK